MQATDRLHALDAVRASALLLGVALHAAQPFISGLYWMITEPPDTAVAALWYTIHMFRMPLFFLIAGLFGRMLLERRGTAGFIKDRSRRILVPLVAGIPIIMLLTGAAYMLGGLAAGVAPQTLRPPAAPPDPSLLSRINLMHLWFLYYLLLFYGAAIVLRAASQSRFLGGRHVAVAIDAGVGFLVRTGTGPLLLAVPTIAYYCRLQAWSPWGGLPAPFSVVPDLGALIAYGSCFAFGWLLQRQLPLLRTLEMHWPRYGLGAVALWAVCRLLAGAVPHWGPCLHGAPLLAYVSCYVAGAWCWSLGLIGSAMRYLSGYSPMRRYLADSSYWIYLMHIAVLIFFAQLLHPLHLASGLKYLLSMAGALLVLLLSYHYLARFSFIGAILNGRRQPRAVAGSLQSSAL
jgi:glucans biosynthesis protein C